MRKQYAWRSMTLVVILALIGLLIPAQMIRIQNSKEAEIFKAQGDRYSGSFQTFYPERGQIYDREGHLLAGNKTVYEIGVDLTNKYRDNHTLALTLSVQLGVDYNETFDAISNPNPNQYYLVVDDFVSAEKATQLKQIKAQMAQQAQEMDGVNAPTLTGLEFKEHSQRSYPEGALASNVLGFVTLDNRGYFGVEEKYNNLLAGNPVTMWVPQDPNRVLEIPQVPDGTSLILSIDRELQSSVENILDESLTTYGAEHGTIVVMNPRNGEILAMASTPRMNLNEFWNYQYIYDNASEFNRAISMPYEPGSVVKILTMAGALQSNTVQPHTPFLDTGAILVGGATITNWDKQAWGQQDMIGCMQHSLNVCLAWVATQMGTQNFYSTMQAFGMGHLTGVDLAGEAAGRLKIPGDEDWYPVDLATNSFGQGIAATPIQMMMAASAIANDGKMVTPHVLHAMVQNGQQYNSSPQFAGSPISSDTAHTLNEMLSISLEQESSDALVSGYRVAGKTGTAQIPTEYGWYDFSKTNTSFIGWGPADNPQFMVYVWLEKPSTSTWGSETAAPVFSEVFQKTALLMNLPPDVVRLQVAAK